jgi:beta-lactamase class A
MIKRLSILLAVVLVCSACSMQGPAKKPAAHNSPAGDQTNNTAQPAADNGTNDVISYANGFDGKVGLFVKNLNTVNAIAVNADEIFPTASTHKLVVALAVYKYLYPEAPVEKKKKYDAHIKKMMTFSDNPTFYELLKEIEAAKPNALTQVLADLHLTKTRIHSGEAFQKYGYHSVTTPHEMAVIFEPSIVSNI